MSNTEVNANLNAIASFLAEMIAKYGDAVLASIENSERNETNDNVQE